MQNEFMHMYATMGWHISQQWQANNAEWIHAYVCYNGMVHVPLKSAPSHVGIWIAIYVSWANTSLHQNNISIGSAILHISSVCPTHI